MKIICNEKEKDTLKRQIKISFIAVTMGWVDDIDLDATEIDIDGRQLDDIIEERFEWEITDENNV